MFSYLTGRSQAVVDAENSCSTCLTTTTGVPQASVLGSLLFSLFINAISVLLKFSQQMIFANDTQIYFTCPIDKLNHCLQQMSYDVNISFDFAYTSGLSLNISKSKVLISGSKPNGDQFVLEELPLVAINGVSISFITEARNFAVFMRTDLSWKSHIAHISKNVHFTLFRLKYHKILYPNNSV